MKENKEQFLSFKEFYLTEAFNPVEIKYGTNEEMDNGNIKNISGRLFTFFEFEGKYYKPAISMNGETGFGLSLNKSLNFSDYNDEVEVTGTNVIKLFNRLFYVYLKLINVVQPDMIGFKGEDVLDRVYDKMVKNKSFNDIMMKNGYSYSGKDQKNYHTYTYND